MGLKTLIKSLKKKYTYLSLKDKISQNRPIFVLT